MGCSPPVRRRWLLLLFVLATLALRTPGMLESLWYDEVFRTHLRLNPEHVADLLFHDVHNFLYNGVLFLWIQVFGDSEISIRLPSLLAGYLSVALFCGWLWTLRGRRVAVLTGAWLLLAPVHVWYSTEAKNNMFTVLMSVLLLVTLERLVTTGRHPWVWAAASAVALALFTDFATLPILAAALVCVGGSLRRSFSWQTTRRVALALGVGLSAALPLVLYKAGRAAELARPYLRRFDVTEAFLLLTNYFSTGNGVLPVNPYHPERAFAGGRLWFYGATGAVVLGLLAIGIYACFRPGATPGAGEGDRSGRPEPWSGWLWLPLVVPLLITLAASTGVEHLWPDGGRRIYQERNLLPTLYPFCAVVLFGVLSLRRRRVRRLLVAGLLGLAVLADGLVLTAYRDTWTVYKPNPDWRAVAHYLEAETAGGRPPVVLENAPSDPLSYYLTGVRRRPLRGSPLDSGSLTRLLQREGVGKVYVVSNHHWSPVASEQFSRIGPGFLAQEGFSTRGLTVYRVFRAPAAGG
ncbi:MAG TPA: glycosyltransferase family 39 protein [Deferrisomatales bacterium]|nr:glycosyltransferase family 39 protein [Deferrisomatales bacterium]